MAPPIELPAWITRAVPELAVDLPPTAIGKDYLGGTLVGTTYTTNVITGPCTVAATFTLNTYAVTPSAGANGTITANPVGGTSPYTYNWGGGITTQSRTVNTTGTYTVTASTVAPAPEPGNLAIVGLAVLAVFKRFRRV